MRMTGTGKTAMKKLTGGKVTAADKEKELNRAATQIHQKPRIVMAQRKKALKPVPPLKQNLAMTKTESVESTTAKRLLRKAAPRKSLLQKRNLNNLSGTFYAAI